MQSRWSDALYSGVPWKERGSGHEWEEMQYEHQEKFSYSLANWTLSYIVQRCCGVPAWHRWPPDISSNLSNFLIEIVMIDWLIIYVIYAMWTWINISKFKLLECLAPSRQIIYFSVKIGLVSPGHSELQNLKTNKIDQMKCLSKHHTLIRKTVYKRNVFFCDISFFFLSIDKSSKNLRTTM